MSVNSGTILLLCALHSFGFAAFHLAFWKLFKWPASLRDATLANRAILQIANVQLVWVFALVGALCLRFPQELATTTLGRWLLAGMSLFWLIRLVGQFVWLRVNHPLVHALSVLFALGVVLFALPTGPASATVARPSAATRLFRPHFAVMAEGAVFRFLACCLHRPAAWSSWNSPCISSPPAPARTVR